MMLFPIILSDPNYSNHHPIFYFLRGLSDFGAEAGACDLSADDFFYIYSVVTVNRNIVGYNKYLLVITVVVVFVCYCYSYCDLVRTV